MTPRFMLDTDTCIHLRKGRDAALSKRFAALEAGEVAISAITYGELCRGALRSSDPLHTLRILERIIAIAPILDVPADAGMVYGKIRVELERAGMIIGSNDLWIAAHAVTVGMTLVSGNLREFRRVTGLNTEDWISPR